MRPARSHPIAVLVSVLLALVATPAIAATQSTPDEGPIVTGSGAELCPWGEELPEGSDVPISEDVTSDAREFILENAPADLAASERLRAAWSSVYFGTLGPITPGCSVYLFDDADIDGIWEWYADDYPEFQAPSPTEEPVPAGAPVGGRLFHRGPSFDREEWSYVFRSGNVIASVSLDAAVDAGITVDDTIAMAQAVAARIDAAAAGQPLPTAPPPPSPTPEPSFPTAAEAALIERVPSSIAESCGRTDFGTSGAALAAVGCNVDLGEGSVTVTYQQFPDQAAMTDVYGNTLSFLGAERDSGGCAGAWPAEGGYTIGGEPAGRIGCSEFGDAGVIISWTDERLLIHGYAEGFDVDRQALYDWWLRDSGPVAPNAANP